MKPSRWTALVIGLAMATQVWPQQNILVIIADDLGVDGVGVYSDDSLFGHPGEGASPGPTPILDALAREGVLFRNAYTNPTCAPTRAAILTGRHGFRTGIGVPEQALLSTEQTVIPEILPGGYRKAAVGKWHLGNNDIDHPIESGFDSFAGSLPGALPDYSSWTKATNEAGAEGVLQPSFSTYATTDTVDEAVLRISEFGDDPWLLWVAFNAAHSPFHAPPSALTSASVTDVSPVARRYDAMVEAMDTELGRLLSSIPDAVLERTTIIFLGDNGTPGRTVEAPFLSDRAKGTLYEGGINVPLIIRSPLVPTESRGTESLALVSSVDIFATVAEITGSDVVTEDSRSLVPYLQDPTLATSQDRPYVYTESFSPNGEGPYTDEQRAIRGERYKLIWRNGVYEELFDLEGDPWEQDNLLDSAPSGDAALAFAELSSAMETLRYGSTEPTTCTADEQRLCLGGRFEVTVEWDDGQGADGEGRVVPTISEDSGLFYFFQEDNWEVLVKVIDGCSVNQHHWVYAAATTDREYRLRVLDTETGASRSYLNVLGERSPATADTNAFDCSDDELAGALHTVAIETSAASAISRPHDATQTETEPATVVPGVCGADSEACLGHRFAVRVSWVDFAQGQGEGLVVDDQAVLVPSNDSALFYFFEQDNWELLIKVIEACDLNQHYWVFAAASTDVGYTVTVTDTETGNEKHYSNPLGTRAAAVTDTSALACATD